MSESLRDQLLGLGFKPAPKPDKPAKPSNPHHGAARPAGGNPSGQGDRRQHDERRKDGRQRDARRGDQRQQDRPQAGKSEHKPRKPRTQEEIDLAKAYAIRAQREKEERIEAERLKQEEARKRREAKAKLAELLKDKALNDPNAEIARHFNYGNKIKRIYVNEAQLKQLNAGELGVVQLDGRYLLVTKELLDEAEAIFAPALALRVDPNASAEEDPYADPLYQVPDDLVW